ncbi:SpaA isopeptide-forming pilin-related protein [Bifidobacterium tissieri]|uniref:SpaA-like prealbumin fold domain-containing protein n=1 Tax=Bifidobacterium tissieri TaxID=1630162 RepID=A0A5M9ZJS5_9BIFI|nr:SpaA isopeptide-forming pilin-related protein [Bifidobacterium tissieri]KAA8827867.1 hypothetical protein EMO89_10005 [Bifidobacterium tissieri]KAA8829989.1 hypothetical protein EM849_10715 [Bifidobacterium tissieri]
MKGFLILVQLSLIIEASLGEFISRLIAGLIAFLMSLGAPPGAHDDSRPADTSGGGWGRAVTHVLTDTADARIDTVAEASDSGGKRVHISSSRFIVAKIEPDAAEFNEVSAASQADAINPDGSVGVRDGGVQFVLWPEYHAADGAWYVYEQRFTEKNDDGTWRDEGRWYQSTLDADGIEGNAWIESEAPNLNDGGSWSPMPQGCDGQLSNGARYCVASQTEEAEYAYWGSNGAASKVYFPVDVDDYTQPYDAHPFKYRVTMSRPSPADETKGNVFFGRDIAEITTEVSHRKDSYWRVNSSYVVQLTDITGKDQIGAQSDANNPSEPNAEPEPEPEPEEGTNSDQNDRAADAADDSQSAVSAGGIVSPQFSNIDSITVDPSKLMVGRAQKPGEFKLLLTALPNDRDGVSTTAEMTPMPNRGFRINDDRMTMGEDWYGGNDQSFAFQLKPGNMGTDFMKPDPTVKTDPTDSPSLAHAASRLNAHLTIAYTTYDVSPGYGSSSSRWFSYQLCEQSPGGGCVTQQDNSDGKVAYDLSRFVIWVRGEIDERNAMTLSSDSYIVRTHDRFGNDLTQNGATEGERGRFDVETLTFAPRFVNAIWGRLSFLKRNEQGTPLPGAEFTSDDLLVVPMGKNTNDGNNGNGNGQSGSYMHVPEGYPGAGKTMISGSDGQVQVFGIDLLDVFGYDDDPNSEQYGELLRESVSYTITETKAPPGYELPVGEPPRFTVILHADGTLTYRPISGLVGTLCEGGKSNSSDCQLAVVNSGFRLLKVDDGGSPLSDAVFQIFEGRHLPDTDNEDGSIPAQPLAFVPITGTGSYNYAPVDTGGADDTGGTTDLAGTTVDLITDDRGTISVHNLPNGTYTIREIRTPVDGDGRELYANKKNVWMLVTVHNGVISLADQSADDAEPDAGNGNARVADNSAIGPDVTTGCTTVTKDPHAVIDTASTLPICVATATNHPSVAELPLTGGGGALVQCALIGIILLILAGESRIIAALLRRPYRT